MANIKNNLKIADKINILRQHAHNLGIQRQCRSENAQSEDNLLQAIQTTSSEINDLVTNDPELSKDYYFKKLSENYRSMASGVRNSWEVDNLLKRDELVFRANIPDPNNIRDLLSMSAPDFFEFLKRSMSKGTP